MTIKEAAEKKYSHLKHNPVVFEHMVRRHINEVTYYESLMRAAGYEWAAGEMEKFIDILRENQQAQIAAYYNHDKTEEEKKIRNAVIEEYRDLILIFKSKFKQQKP